MDCFYIDCCIIPFKLLNAMLRKKARELTWKILSKVKVKDLTAGFDELYPCILKFLENVYIEARLDANHKVKYEVLDDFTLYFPDQD